MIVAETLGWILIAFGAGVLFGAYLKIPHRELEAFRDQGWDDHRLTVWERLPLYDWAERGELGGPTGGFATAPPED